MSEAAAAPAADTPASALAASPTPAPSPAPANDWRASLPEDIRDNPSLRDIKDVGNLAKSYLHAQKLVGMDRSKLLTVPGDDAPPEAWNEFYDKAGRPADPKDYTLPVDKVEWNDVVTRDENMEQWFAKTAHEAGLTPRQAEKLFTSYVDQLKASGETTVQQMRQAYDQGVNDLKTEWGSAFEQKVAAADAVIDKLGVPGFRALLDVQVPGFGPLGDHPALVKALNTVATIMGEDAVTDRSKGSSTAYAPAEAKAEIARKMGDKVFMEAYLQGDHPNHKFAVDEMARLHRAAGGSR